MTSTPRPRFDQWLLAQTDREDPVGDIAREFSEDRSVGCAGDICTPEQLISHIERVHHASDLAICAFEQARAEYLRGRVDPLRACELGVRAPGVQKFSGASLPDPFGGREPPSAQSTSNQAAAP
jgi:hypothetical protein